MGIFEYKETEDYKKAIKLILEFKEEVLAGDLKKLINADLSELIYNTKDRRIIHKYVGKIKDPDMYLITQAIYIVVWGYIYGLTFDKLGVWGNVADRQYPFRGDTMNSFNSVYGEDCVIAKRYKLDDTLMNMVKSYHKLYHSIGNFIVIPNKMNVNRKRANYFSLQDFYDSFIGVIYQFYYPEKETEYSVYYNELISVLEENVEYKSINFETWIKKFFLDTYLDNHGIPFNVFGIDLEMRKKEYIDREIRSKNNFYSKDEYVLLAKNYYEIAKQIIDYRAKKIVGIIIDRVNEEDVLN